MCPEERRFIRPRETEQLIRLVLRGFVRRLHGGPKIVQKRYHSRRMLLQQEMDPPPPAAPCGLPLRLHVLEQTARLAHPNRILPPEIRQLAAIPATATR
jgi:hypothetical protein